MRARRQPPGRCLPAGAAFALAWAAGHALGGPAAAPAAPGILLRGEAGPGHLSIPADLAALPAARATAATGHGAGERHSLEVDAARPRDQVRQMVAITGRDGHTAILALGGTAPGFENRQVIVADRMDGRPLDPLQLRIVAPGDKRGGRGVRDVASIAVLAAKAPPP